jgi:hypothetical protein
MDNLHFYEVVTQNVKMPVGWLLYADGSSWTRFERPATLTLNIDASTTEARDIVEQAVVRTPDLQVVVCYRETADGNHLRMLVFKGTEDDLEGYRWDEGHPHWFFRAEDQPNRYDKLAGDDLV